MVILTLLCLSQLQLESIHSVYYRNSLSKTNLRWHGLTISIIKQLRIPKIFRNIVMVSRNQPEPFS